jgi:hypothetical protein
MPVLPGGSGATHNFFRRHAGGSNPVAATLGPRGVDTHCTELGTELGAQRAQIRRNIDPLPARQDDIARKDPKMPIFPTVALDNISGAYRETLRQGGRLTVDWQTHDTLFVWVGNFQNSNTGNVGKFRLLSDGPVTLVDCCG